MKRFGWFLIAAGVAIAAFVTLRRVRERAEYEDEWEAETPAAVGVEEALAEQPAAEEELAAEEAPIAEEVVVEEVEVVVSEPVVDDETTFVTATPLVVPTEPEAPAAEEDVPAVVEAPAEEEGGARDDDTFEGPSPITRLHTDRDTAELRERIAESRSRMRDKARRARGGGAEPDAGEPEAG